MPTTVSDRALALRQATVAYLRADPEVAERVAARVWAEGEPAEPEWPWVRVTIAANTVQNAQAVRGSEHRLSVHGFARGPYTDEAFALGAAIEAAMEAFSDENSPEHRQTTMLSDPGGWHVVCDFDVLRLEFAP